MFFSLLILLLILKSIVTSLYDHDIIHWFYFSECIKQDCKNEYLVTGDWSQSMQKKKPLSQYFRFPHCKNRCKNRCNGLGWGGAGAWGYIGGRFSTSFICSNFLKFSRCRCETSIIKKPVEKSKKYFLR